MTGTYELCQSVGVSALLLAALFLPPLKEDTPAPSPSQPETVITETDTPTTPVPDAVLDSQTVLQVLDGETVLEMTLSDYLVGVVRAEMPASFHLEALKAQAAAARTYTLYKLQNGGNHGETADICTNSACCQAYCGEADARAKWGAEAELYLEKVETAVKDTDGQVIWYAGEPILAVFHSSSSGLTRAAGEVWLSDVPYLQAVTSPEAEGSIPNYYSRAVFSAEDFRQTLLAEYPQADLSGSVDSWLANGETDAAGNVRSLTVGGVSIKGSQLRNLLGLRSACFTWEAQAHQLVFYVTGYGHGVGLSQYGANQMALNGADYREILTHYYTGVTVEARD